MRNFAFNVAGLFVLVLCLSLGAAPGPQPRGESVIEGTLVYSSNSPVVKTAIRHEDGTWYAAEYWLVYTSGHVEKQVMKIEPETKVRVTGKHGAGGQYLYVVVSTIETK